MVKESWLTWYEPMIRTTTQTLATSISQSGLKKPTVPLLVRMLTGTCWPNAEKPKQPMASFKPEMKNMELKMDFHIWDSSEGGALMVSCSSQSYADTRHNHFANGSGVGTRLKPKPDTHDHYLNHYLVFCNYKIWFDIMIKMITKKVIKSTLQ